MSEFMVFEFVRKISKLSNYCKDLFDDKRIKKLNINMCATLIKNDE